MKCYECGDDNPDNFNRNKGRSTGFCSACKECDKKIRTASCRKVRREVLEAYGGNPLACKCCGEQAIEFLMLDHVNGGGNKERERLNNKGGEKFYRWLRSQGFPPGYRVLCANCNHALGAYGYCPHSKQN